MTRAIVPRLFFTVFLGIVLLAGVRNVQPYWKGLLSYDYVQTRCTILANRFVKAQDGSISLMLRYQYMFEGQRQEGSRFRWGLEERGTQRNNETRSFVRHYRPGQQTVCYVNPRNPRESAIRTGSTATQFHEDIIFAVFGIIALGGFLLAVFRPEAMAMRVDGDGSSDADGSDGGGD